MGKKKLGLDEIVCFVCGDKGVVPKLYIDRECGLKEGQQLVRCPRCAKGDKKSEKLA
jgi:hypothetical protein